MQANRELPGKARRVVGVVIIFFLSLVLLGSAGAKFAHVPKVASQMGAMGLDGNRLMFVAMLELVSAGLFVARPTRAAGLLMVSAFMGGAIATHLEHGQPIVQPAIFLVLLWLGAWLRHPEILWSFTQPSPGKMPLAPPDFRQGASGRI